MKKRNSGFSKLHVKNYRKHTDSFGDWMGYEIIKIDREKFEGELRLMVRKDHLSPANRVHGGVVSACFDCALSLSVFAGMEPWDLCSTVELKVNYFKPLFLGDELIFKSKAAFRGKRLWSAHGFLYVNGEEEPAAMANGTWNIVRAAVPEEAPRTRRAQPARRAPKARGRKS